MKILFLSMHYRPEPCDTRTSQLAKAMAARGHQTTALTSFPNYPYGQIYDGYKQRLWQKSTVDGVNLIRVPMYPDHSRSAKRRALSYLSFGVSAAFLGAFLTRRPDLVWIHHPPLTTGIAGYLLARLKRVPYVYEVHDLWPETLTGTGMIREGRITRAIRRICNFLYKRAAAIVVTSNGIKEHLVRQGVDGDKLHVMHQWADETAFKPVPRDAAFGRRYGLEGKFNIFFTGNMGIAQHLDTVLDAAAKLRDLPQVQFVMVGAGVELERLHERTKAEGLDNVSFVGQFPPDVMPSFFAWADGLLTHLKDDPLFAITIPSKTQVYLSAGKPILCGVAGDAADVVRKGEAGLVFPPESADAMAAAVRQLHSLTVDEREAMGARAARAYRDHFSENVLQERYEQLFASLVRKPERTLVPEGNRPGDVLALSHADEQSGIGGAALTNGDAAKASGYAAVPAESVVLDHSL